MIHIAVAADPGDTTGIGLWSVGAGSHYIASAHLSISRAGWSEEKGVATLDEMIGPDVQCIFAVEKPFAQKRGRATDASRRSMTTPPTFAEQHWKRIIGLLARARAMRRGVGFRLPMILSPSPEQWRGPLGLPTKGVGVDAKERRKWLKQKAVDRLAHLYGLSIDQPDEAEAVCISEYLARVAALPKIPGKQIALRTPKFVP